MTTLYLIENGVMQTTAARVAVTTGNVIKTMLQVKPFCPIKVVEWGISFDGIAAATPGKVELIETDVTATVTTLADADVTKLGPHVADAVNPSVAGITFGTAATGFTATVEGSTTAVRQLAPTQFIAPTSQYSFQFPLGREPIIQTAKFARIRVTFAAAVNCYCYMVVEI
jgi:hypothetical protein